MDCLLQSSTYLQVSFLHVTAGPVVVIPRQAQWGGAGHAKLGDKSCEDLAPRTLGRCCAWKMGGGLERVAACEEKLGGECLKLCADPSKVNTQD